MVVRVDFVSDKIVHDEPWKLLRDGVVAPGGDGYAVPHRKVIKTERNAPHLAIIMPIGGKETVDVAECEHCHARTRVAPGTSYHGPGLVPVELMVNFMNVMIPLNVSMTFLTLKNHISAVLRESMTEQALAMGANFIFYWDDDTLIPPDTWYKMLRKMATNPDVGIITGVYFTKMDPSEPVLYKDASVGAYWGFDLDPNAPLEDIYAAGAGCMMVRADAIRQMKKPYWFDERSTSEDFSSHTVSGHDIRFCQKMHKETDYRVTVDGSIQCMHFDMQKQIAYQIPDDCPAMDTARRVSNRHVLMEEEEKPPPTPISISDTRGTVESSEIMNAYDAAFPVGANNECAGISK